MSDHALSMSAAARWSLYSLLIVIAASLVTARIMRNRSARKIAQDGFGSLWRFENFDGEPLVMVCVRNSTPEPDGTFKDYWLRVPPHVVSPRQAVAWTFDMTPHQYQPSAQT